MKATDGKPVVASKSGDNQLVRILFIGNSFTARNDLPGMIRALGAAAKPARIVETSSIVAGGASLRRHWNAGTALKSLQSAHWDFVVLQEQSTLPIKNPVRYHENVRLFAADGVHPTPAGTYLAALVFCDLLFGMLPSAESIFRTIGLSDGDAEALHTIAQRIRRVS